MPGPYVHRGPQVEKDAASLVTALYNADRHAIDRLLYKKARSPLQELERRVFPNLPSALRAADPHVQTFRGIVDRWLAGTLRDEDLETMLLYVAQAHRSPRLLTRSWKNYLLHSVKTAPIGQLNTDPPEPVTRAFRALLHLIHLEDYGASEFRPLRCGYCERLFVPTRPTWQTTCSPKCNRGRRYERFIARTKGRVQLPAIPGGTGREAPVRAKRDARHTDPPG